MTIFALFSTGFQTSQLTLTRIIHPIYGMNNPGYQFPVKPGEFQFIVPLLIIKHLGIPMDIGSR